MHAQLKSRFARGLVESLHASSGGTALEQLRTKLPQRLQDVLAADVFAARDFNRTMALDDAESLLFAVDAALGDGSGRLLEDAATAFASPLVAEISRRHPDTDLKNLVSHLRAPLQHPFEGVTPRFEITDIDAGFTVTVGVSGRSTTTRLLRHVATGYIRAASRRLGLASLRILGETLGSERCVLSIYTLADDAPVSRAPMSTRRSAAWRLSASGGLSSEVERILGSAPTVPSFRSPVLPEREEEQNSELGSDERPSGERMRSGRAPSFDDAAPTSGGTRYRR